MDKVKGYDMDFIYKKRGHSREMNRRWIERKHILKPDKTRIFGKRKYNERLQEYQLSQIGRKRIVVLKIEVYNRFFHYCETLGSTPYKSFSKISTNHGSTTTYRMEKAK